MTDEMKVIFQTEHDGLVRCLEDHWEKQKACSLSCKSENQDRCMFYFETLQHCWLPLYKE